MSKQGIEGQQKSWIRWKQMALESNNRNLPAIEKHNYTAPGDLLVGFFGQIWRRQFG
jgi:hypothetical protein